MLSLFIIVSMESTDSKYLDEYRIIKTLGQGYHAK